MNNRVAIPVMPCITPEFMRFAWERFQLDWHGLHGLAHWRRVCQNGLLLAERYDVDTEVIQWFAFLHDLERQDDYEDLLHGERAADLAAAINHTFMGLSRQSLALLEFACRGHSDDYTMADITVRVCWDADRLDLGRVGVYPNPHYLCTSKAREARVIEAAYDRAVVAS